MSARRRYCKSNCQQTTHGQIIILRQKAVKITTYIGVQYVFHFRNMSINNFITALPEIVFVRDRILDCSTTRNNNTKLLCTI